MQSLELPTEYSKQWIRICDFETNYINNMKKFILFLAVLCGTYYLFDSCIGCGSEEKEDAVFEPAVEKSYSDYKDACRDLNFEEAHRLLEDMDDNDRYCYGDKLDARRYIFKKESMYLLSLNTEEAKRRIVFLFKELELEDGELYDIIEVVIEMDDAQFAKRLIELLYEGEKIIGKKNVLNYLSKKKDVVLSDLLLHSLMVSKGNLKLPPMNEGIVTYEYSNVHDYAKEHNDKCSDVLATAIKHKNKYLAEQTIGLFSRDYYIMNYDDPNPNSRVTKYKLSSSTETIEFAKEMLRNAFNSSVFAQE